MESNAKEVIVAYFKIGTLLVKTQKATKNPEIRPLSKLERSTSQYVSSASDISQIAW
jgi:hypothetical protein